MFGFFDEDALKALHGDERVHAFGFLGCLLQAPELAVLVVVVGFGHAKLVGLFFVLVDSLEINPVTHEWLTLSRLLLSVRARVLRTKIVRNLWWSDTQIEFKVSRHIYRLKTPL